MSVKRRRAHEKTLPDGTVVLSAQRIGQISGYNEQYIRRLANKQELPGHLEGNRWFFEEIPTLKALGVLKSDTAKNSTAKISDEVLLDDPCFGF